jgi:antitoxin FitA
LKKLKIALTGRFRSLLLQSDFCPFDLFSAIIDSNAIIDIMASITIRQLEESTKRKLRMRAASHGRSMEQEAREILKSALSQTEEEPPKDIGKAIRDIFAPLGGVELKIPPRGPIRDPGIK